MTEQFWLQWAKQQARMQYRIYYQNEFPVPNIREAAIDPERALFLVTFENDRVFEVRLYGIAQPVHR